MSPRGISDNPANLPEVRPIEDFWSVLKVKVYENNWEAKSLHQLEVRIKKCLKEVDPVRILKTFGCVKKDFTTFACLILLKIENKLF